MYPSCSVLFSFYRGVYALSDLYLISHYILKQYQLVISEKFGNQADFTVFDVGAVQGVPSVHVQCLVD